MFCGNSIITNRKEINIKAESIIKGLVKNGVNVFYTNGISDFDVICENYVCKLKAENNNIRLCLVIPYKTKFITNKIKNNSSLYNNIIDYNLEEKEKDFSRNILNINKETVNKSDYILVCLTECGGTAYNTLKYAIANNKNIIDISE